MSVAKGTVLNGPLGSGYKITRDIESSEPIRAEQFEAFGGAPEPKAGGKMPDWLWTEIVKLSRGHGRYW